MIRHIVILHFKKSSLDYFALLEKTKPFLREIPGIISYKIYPNDSRYVPKDIISAGVEILFENKNPFEIFMEHPKHYEANAIFEQHLADPPYMVLTHSL